MDDKTTDGSEANEDEGVYGIAESINQSDHVMGAHLRDYIRPKIHQLIRSRHWRTITVVGKYARGDPYIPIDTERSEELFDWHRPTARIVSDDALEIACFPGRCYVLHYATLIASYLKIFQSPEDTRNTTVRYELLPNTTAAFELLHPYLRILGNGADTVVFGQVGHLRTMAPTAQWRWIIVDGLKTFGWQSFRTVDGRRVTFLGSVFSIWGDIAAHMVRAIFGDDADARYSHALYVGKAGAIRLDAKPNSYLCTGCTSRLNTSDDDSQKKNGTLISWRDGLADSSTCERESKLVLTGTHMNVPSPLFQDTEWLARMKRLSIDWVECEVAYMAMECNRLDIRYDYLHIISDNVARQGSYGLWNEDNLLVRQERQVLEDHLSRILNDYITSISLSEAANRMGRLDEGSERLQTREALNDYEEVIRHEEGK